MKTGSRDSLMEAMLSERTWAVVGASPNKSRFGYRIYCTLKAHGYEVYAVNPDCGSIDGDPVFPDVTSLPAGVACVDMVVKPEIGKRILPAISAAGIRYVWFQPGTMDPELLKMAEELGLEVVDRGCVMARLGGMPGGCRG